MSAIDIEKNREVKKVKKRLDKKIAPLKGEDRTYFSKIRTAIKTKK